MKKQLLTLFGAALLFAACSSDSDDIAEVKNSKPVFTAQTEIETRTSLGEGNNILWSEGDQVTVFLKNSASQRYNVTEGAGTNKAKLTPDVLGEAGVSDWMHNVAIYPYRGGEWVSPHTITMSGNNYVIGEVDFYTNQRYVEGRNSFGEKFMPMVAVSENENLNFKNVGAVLKLNIKAGHNTDYQRYDETIKEIKISGADISGVADVTVDENGNSTVAMTSNVNHHVTLAPQNDFIMLSRETAKSFYVVIPPTEFKNGITFEIKDKDGRIMTKTTKPITVKRNQLISLPEFELLTY